MGASVGPKIQKINNIVFSYDEHNLKKRGKFGKLPLPYVGIRTQFHPPLNHRLRRTHNDALSSPTTMKAEGASVSVWTRRKTDSGISGYDAIVMWGTGAARWLWLGFFNNEVWDIHYSIARFSSNSGTAKTHQNILARYIWTGTVGTWFNLISTYDKSTRLASLYKDGVLIGSGTRLDYGDLQYPTPPTPLKIFGTRNGDTYTQTDSCKIWDIALSAAEVKKEFNRFKRRYGL